ncbi:MAG: FecR domain-containing protein, partial [Bacteroidota bacterium]
YQLFSKEEMIIITGSATGVPIKLTDGSKVWLNEGALLKYPKRFLGNARKVYLEGEGFFEVIRDEGSPFTVSTNRSQIHVLGTSFNILETDSTTRVSVSSGSVRVSVKNKNESVELVNGEEALVSLNAVTQRKASPNYASWRTGEFTFDNTPLPKVIAKLKTYYRSGLPNDIPESDCRLTAKISNMNVNEVIELLKEVCDINF